MLVAAHVAVLSFLFPTFPGALRTNAACRTDAEMKLILETLGLILDSLFGS